MTLMFFHCDGFVCSNLNTRLRICALDCYQVVARMGGLRPPKLPCSLGELRGPKRGIMISVGHEICSIADAVLVTLVFSDIRQRKKSKRSSKSYSQSATARSRAKDQPTLVSWPESMVCHSVPLSWPEHVISSRMLQL